jgi:hypothetical protein
MLGFESRVTFLFRPKAFVTGGGRGGGMLVCLMTTMTGGREQGPLIVCWHHLTEEARAQNWVVM